MSSGKARAPALARRRRIGRLVGGDHRVARIALAAAADEHSDRQILGTGDEVAEGQPGVTHPLIAGEHAGVEDDQAIDTVGLLDRDAQADRSAPIVHDEGGAGEVEVFQQRRQRGDVAVIAVPVLIGWLVGAPEAREVGSHAAKAGVAHGGDHRPPQKRPRRLAVHEHHRRPVALVEVGEPQSVPRPVAGGEGKVRQAFEELVRGADGVGHGASISRALGLAGLRSGRRGQGPWAITRAASEATVTSISPGYLAQAIRLRACRRSSMACSALAWAPPT